MKKIKILHIITSLEQGGAQAVLYTLLQSLDHKTFEHHVAYFHTGPYVEKIRCLDIPLYHVRGLLSVYDPVCIWRLGKIVQAVAPDIIHTLLWSANFFGRLYAAWYGIQHVQVLHNNMDQNGVVRNGVDRLAIYLLARTKKNQVSTTVAVSRGVVDSVCLYTPWIGGKNSIKVILNGIDTQQVAAHVDGGPISRAQLLLKDSDFVIGAVGRLEPVKNYYLMLTVFALLYDRYNHVYLVIIGSGSQEQNLKKRAYDLGIDDRVIFIVGKDAKEYYPQFDCFVMTSYKEGVSIALLEAMANGVVPIVMAVDGQHDVVEHGKNGLLAYSDKPEDYVQPIEMLLQSQALCAKLSEGACNTVKNSFKVDSMIDKYSTLYLQMFMNTNEPNL